MRTTESEHVDLTKIDLTKHARSQAHTVTVHNLYARALLMAGIALGYGRRRENDT